MRTEPLFWCVWAENGGSPTVKHLTVGTAPPFPTFKAGMEWLAAALAETGSDDATRAEFDGWVRGVDAASMDAYQLARLYARRALPAENIPHSPSGEDASAFALPPDEPDNHNHSEKGER